MEIYYFENALKKLFEKKQNFVEDTFEGAYFHSVHTYTKNITETFSIFLVYFLDAMGRALIKAWGASGEATSSLTI